MELMRRPVSVSDVMTYEVRLRNRPPLRIWMTLPFLATADPLYVKVQHETVTFHAANGANTYRIIGWDDEAKALVAELSSSHSAAAEQGST